MSEVIDGIQAQECIGCGFCCRKAPCQIAQRIHGSGITECPELQWNGSRWICGAVHRARGPLADQYRRELAIGAGCCCGLNDYRQRGYPPTPEELAPVVGFDPIPRWVQFFIGQLGRNMVSPDVIYLILLSLRKRIADEEGDERANFVVREIVRCFNGQRSEFDTGFIGDDVSVPEAR